MFTRRDVLMFGLAIAQVRASRPHPAYAQSAYPDHPIKLVVPFGPGGVSDVVGRLWADKMKSLLGPAFVENQGGAGGLVAGAAVARAKPDGDTLLLGSVGSQIPVPSAASPVPYDPVKDFEPVSILGVTALAIVVHPALLVRTLQELVSYAKAGQGRLAYGSGGSGTATHLAGELFKSLTGAADIAHVPYKGGGQMVTDVINGHLPMMMVNVTGQLLELHRAGKVRMLAVTTPSRIVAAPEIPTAVEAGVPGMIAQNFNGLFAPAGTPKPIIERIADATGLAMGDEQLRQRLIAAGFEPSVDFTPATARRFMEDEIARWAPIINVIGSHPD
jgi:tripartite-type tricarboxylate transporter receptor subunit TctC